MISGAWVRHRLVGLRRRVSARVHGSPVWTSVLSKRETRARDALRRSPWLRSVAGYQMRVDPGDERAIALALAGGTIDHALIELWGALYDTVRPAVIVDVGANYGEVLLSTRYGDGPTLVAFEPNPRIAACLQESLVANGLSAVVHEMAVGDRTGRVQLHVDPVWSGKSTVVRPAEGWKTVDVEVRRLDDLVTVGTGQDVMVKIDVEGAELDVLRGAGSLLARARTSVVVAEVAMTDVRGLLDWTCEMDMRCFAIDRRRKWFLPADEATLSTAQGDVAGHPFLRDVVILGGEGRDGQLLQSMPAPFRLMKATRGDEA